MVLFFSVGKLAFCTALDSGDPCGEQVGTFVDLGILIDGASVDASLANGEAVLELSNEVSVDGSWVALPTGDPLVDKKRGL